jgi:hypothetical protein
VEAEQRDGLFVPLYLLHLFLLVLLLVHLCLD